MTRYLRTALPLMILLTALANCGPAEDGQDSSRDPFKASGEVPRSVELTVGSTPVGEAEVWAYPDGEDLGNFLVPVYELTASGIDDTGTAVTQTVKVLRFGVEKKGDESPHIVGLADQQTHVIKAWIPTYTVHSADSPEKGAWQVKGNYLIHDGPDDDTELFATLGCIEIMGPQGFIKFNDLILSLSGLSSGSRAEQLPAIGRAGQMSITYVEAEPPPLKPL